MHKRGQQLEASKPGRVIGTALALTGDPSPVDATFTEPGRYMFTFGWVNVTADDLAIWQQFPNASFALVKMRTEDVEDEYRLGAFDPGDPPDDRPHGD